MWATCNSSVDITYNTDNYQISQRDEEGNLQKSSCSKP